MWRCQLLTAYLINSQCIYSGIRDLVHDMEMTFDLCQLLTAYVLNSQCIYTDIHGLGHDVERTLDLC